MNRLGLIIVDGLWSRKRHVYAPKAHMPYLDFLGEHYFSADISIPMFSGYHKEIGYRIAGTGNTKPYDDSAYDENAIREIVSRASAGSAVHVITEANPEHPILRAILETQIPIHIHALTETHESVSDTEDALAALSEHARKSKGSLASVHGTARASGSYESALETFKHICGSGKTTMNIETALAQSRKNGIYDSQFKSVCTHIPNQNPKYLSENDILIALSKPFALFRLLQFASQPYIFGFDGNDAYVPGLEIYAQHEYPLPIKRITCAEEDPADICSVASSYDKHIHSCAESMQAAFIRPFFTQTEHMQEIIPSVHADNYADIPELTAGTVSRRAVHALSNKTDIHIVSYGNIETIARTGSMNALAESMKYIDMQLERLINAYLAHQTSVMIFSPTVPEALYDSCVRDQTSAYAPIHIIEKKRYVRKKTKTVTEPYTLQDIFPTALKMLSIPVPEHTPGNVILYDIEL